MVRFSFVAALMILAGCVQERSNPVRLEADAGEQLSPDITRDKPTQRPTLRLSRRADPVLLPSDLVARSFPAYGVALHHMANVYAEPDPAARIVGYLRRGALFRAGEETGRKGCGRGWFAVPGGGFVCNGEGFLIDSRPRTFTPSPMPASLTDALPYQYGKVVSNDVLQFARFPSANEEQQAQTAIAGVSVDAGTSLEQELEPAVAQLVRARMQPGFYVSLDGNETVDERVFARTVRGTYVRADQLVPGKLPAGKGVALGGRLKLPVAFVYRGGAPALMRDPATLELKKLGRDLTLHSAHQLTGQVILKGDRRYFVTSEGLLLRDTAVRVVEKVKRPPQLKARERWIRVDRDRQTLTAYEGDEPVFATLVSTGLDDHATPTGLFRLHAKHVTATMADDRAADGPYSIEDVPWTMYFHGSYALHAAFWHDRFGNQRSHGCVNLAPRDARWLFFWTSPVLPSAWHGVMANVGEGTAVFIETGSASALESGEATTLAVR